MAAADDPRLESGLPEVLDQGDRQRSLARSADGDVADDDHRHRKTRRRKDADPVEHRPQCRQEAEDDRERKEKPCEWSAPGPDFDDRTRAHARIIVSDAGSRQTPP